MSTAHERQDWLDGAATLLRTYFAECGQPVPPAAVRVTWGFPARRATGKRKAIGVHFAPEATRDAHSEIFIHPIHATREAPEIEIAATLAHELGHATLGNAVGHKSPFKRLVTALGLTGKPTHTVAGPEFRTRLTERLNVLGPFPTSGLDPSADGIKKQTTRLLKCECAECHYIARVASSWLESVGPPLCPCNREPMERPE